MQLSNLGTDATLFAIGSAAVAFALRQAIKLIGSIKSNTRRQILECLLVGAQSAWNQYVHDTKAAAYEKGRSLTADERLYAQRLALDAADAEAAARKLTAWQKITPAHKATLLETAVRKLNAQRNGQDLPE